MNNADMPASPVTDSRGPFMQQGKPSIGLTKRERFAMAAMQGLLSAVDSEGTWTGLDCADQAVKEADALLSALQGDKDE